jgi:hypothetical protein
MNTTVTLEEAKRGTNMFISAKNNKTLSIVESTLSQIGNGAYAKDNKTLYLHVSPAQGKTLKESLLFALEQNGVNTANVKISRITTNESPLTRFALKEGVVVPARDNANTKRIRLTREGLSRLVTKAVNEALSKRDPKLASLPFDQQVSILTNEARKHMIQEGTSNFFLINSDTYHVLPEPEDENGNRKEWDDMEYDFAIEDVRETFLSNGWDTCDKDKRYSYDSYSIGVDKTCEPESFETPIYIIVLVCPGYYESATIDYEIVCDFMKLSDFNSIEEFAAECVEWCGSSETDEDKQKEIAEVVASINAGIANFEEVVEKCTVPYGVYARFSNGETMYKNLREEDVEHGATDENEDIYSYSYFANELAKFGWSFHDSYVDDNDGSVIFAIDKDRAEGVELDELKAKLREIYGNNIKFGTRTAVQAPELKSTVVKLIYAD